MNRENLLKLVENLGEEYSGILGLDLSLAKDSEVFKWFMASLLFGAPIAESSVIKTYRCFLKNGILTPKSILDVGWDNLVRILDEGTYTRYDFKTADKLLKVMQNLIHTYMGSLNAIHRQAHDARDLEGRLKKLGKGIGDVTVSIFLRELRNIWEKADPYPTHIVIDAAERLGIITKDTSAAEALRKMKRFWSKNAIEGKSFVNFETALLRAGKDYFRKRRKIPFFNQ